MSIIAQQARLAIRSTVTAAYARRALVLVEQRRTAELARLVEAWRSDTLVWAVEEGGAK